MSAKRYQFEWWAPEGRHSVVEASRQKYLVGPHPIGSERSGWIYAPLETETALFRVFAQTEPSEEGISEFADKYGMLGEHDAPQLGAIPLNGKSGSLYHAESLGLWTTHIVRMNELIELWDHVSSQNVRWLREVIKWGSKSVSYESGNSFYTFPIEVTKQRFKKNEIVKPAKHYLQRGVNEQLKARFSKRLLWDGDDLGLFDVPTSLLGAIWLQFASAISEKKKYRECLHCHQYFEIGSGTSRTDKATCSDRCRKAVSRRRAEK